MDPFVDVEFAGGVELLFNNARSLRIPLSDETAADGKLVSIKDLLLKLRSSYLKQRPELFMQGDDIKPGILVVINECDWELMGGLNYKLEPKDKIVFISTLHGG